MTRTTISKAGTETASGAGRTGSGQPAPMGRGELDRLSAGAIALGSASNTFFASPR